MENSQAYEVMPLAWSDERDKLVPALIKAQRSADKVLKNATAEIRGDKGNYDYGYADLAAVLAAVVPHLNDNGVLFIQGVHLVPGRAIIATELVHESGQYVKNVLTLAYEGSKPQSVGSGITYARRYAAQAILGIAPKEDDDGAGAAGGARGRQQRNEPASDRPPAEQTESQRANMNSAFAKLRSAGHEKDAVERIFAGVAQEAKLPPDTKSWTASQTAAFLTLLMKSPEMKDANERAKQQGATGTRG